MSWLPVSETTLDSHPPGTEVWVHMIGVLDGYLDHAGQRRITVRFPMGTAEGEGSTMLPPNAQVRASSEMVTRPRCTCSPGHRTKMARYSQPHAKHCPLRTEDDHVVDAS